MDHRRSDRLFGVTALGMFGGEELIPALQQVAESDPAVSRTRHTSWIRQDAVKAIADIRKRSSVGPLAACDRSVLGNGGQTGETGDSPIIATAVQCS